MGNAEARPPHFCLSKWYLDAVGDSGEVFMGYRAALRWRRLGVAYASVLRADDSGPSSSATIRPGLEPDFREGAVVWNEPALEVSATWRGAGPSIARTLYETPEGAVVWNCLLPSAQAEIHRGEAELRGLGYAEHLSMTIPPWRLPIDTLRWGRFLAPGRSVVWIDWENGSDANAWVFREGQEALGEVCEEEIFFEGGRLRLPQASRLLLREGRLSHLLRNLPLPLALRLSRSALAIHETKWLTRGVLDLADAPPVEGWAIHEVVRLRP